MGRTEKVLILTPVKDACRFLDGYFRRLRQLTYPAQLLSLGFLESDSLDDTFSELQRRVPELEGQFRRVGLWKRDFGYRIRPGTPRWAMHVQLRRRSIL